MTGKQIEAQEALKHFGGKGIQVQTAASIEVKGEDGKLRPAFKTATATLRAEHVLAARDYGDRVTITTLDGRRHEAAKSARETAAEREAREKQEAEAKAKAEAEAKAKAEAEAKGKK